MLEEWQIDYVFLRSSESYTGPILRRMNQQPLDMHSLNELKKHLKITEKTLALAIDWLLSAELVIKGNTTYDIAQKIGGYRYLRLTDLGQRVARRLDN